MPALSDRAAEARHCTVWNRAHGRQNTAAAEFRRWRARRYPLTLYVRRRYEGILNRIHCSLHEIDHSKPASEVGSASQNNLSLNNLLSSQFRAESTTRRMVQFDPSKNQTTYGHGSCGPRPRKNTACSILRGKTHHSSTIYTVCGLSPATAAAELDERRKYDISHAPSAQACPREMRNVHIVQPYIPIQCLRNARKAFRVPLDVRAELSGVLSGSNAGGIQPRSFVLVPDWIPLQVMVIPKLRRWSHERLELRSTGKYYGKNRLKKRHGNEPRLEGRDRFIRTREIRRQHCRRISRSGRTSIQLPLGKSFSYTRKSKWRFTSVQSIKTVYLL